MRQVWFALFWNGESMRLDGPYDDEEVALMNATDEISAEEEHSAILGPIPFNPVIVDRLPAEDHRPIER